MPKTSPEDAKDVMFRIKNECADIKIKAIKGSISMGSATKQTANQKIMRTLEYAEDTMYSVKTLERDNIRNSAIDSIVSLLHQNSKREKEHSLRVSELCQKLGKTLNLPDREIRKLKEAGYLHDIGKIVLEPELMNKNHLLTNLEWNEVKRHSIIGYRILNSFDNTLDLAESVLAHHERWNGSGYPKGLKGEEIPKLARIIAIVEGYDRMTHDSDNIKAMSKEDAIQTLKDNAGILFDPKLVDVFTEMVQEGTT
jgi:putative nucleotidyltransferase with HDIG domain